MELLFWPLLGALIGAAAAQKKGFSTAAGAAGGALLGPFAFLIFFVSGVSPGEQQKKCPFCAEWVKAEAKVCKHCHRDLTDGQRLPVHRAKVETTKVQFKGLIAVLIFLAGLGIAIPIASRYLQEKAREDVRREQERLLPFDTARRADRRGLGTIPAPLSSTGTTPGSAPIEGGSWGGYQYVYSEMAEQRGRFYVTFMPFLPRNDEIVIGVLRHLAQRLYSLDTGFAKPSLVERDGVNVIQLSGSNSSALFLPAKDDTGEVSSLITWRE